MSGEMWGVFTTASFFVALLAIAGFYCVFVTRNMIRAVIGLELLIKGATLLIIAAGYVTGRPALAQSLVITVIVIEVVVAVVAGGIALRVFRHQDSLDVRLLKKMKG